MNSDQLNASVRVSIPNAGLKILPADLLTALAKIRAFVMFASVLSSEPVTAQSENFDSVKPGELPPGWLAGVTGPGNPKWAVVRDDSAPGKPNVLQQSGEGKYPWCVRTNVLLKDAFVEVKFKAVSGKEDQAGGLIWRWQDGDNYYIARANALEDNVTIYETLKGKRTERKRFDVKVTGNQWHKLRVDFKGNHFIVTFDSTKVLEWEDATFSQAGAVGVWTKADSVTLFNDFSFGPSGEKVRDAK
jgi:hypothetical protein